MVLYENLEVNLGKNETHLNFSLEEETMTNIHNQNVAESAL